MAAGVPLENAKVAEACGAVKGELNGRGDGGGGEERGRHRWSHSNIRAVLCYIKEQR